MFINGIMNTVLRTQIFCKSLSAAELLWETIVTKDESYTKSVYPQWYLKQVVHVF